MEEQEADCTPLPLLYITLGSSPVVSSAVFGPESCESMGCCWIMIATAFFHDLETPVDPDSFHGAEQPSGPPSLALSYLNLHLKSRGWLPGPSALAATSSLTNGRAYAR